MGPHKDIVGLFEQSARKYKLPFGVSSHDDRFLSWWLPAFGSDTSGVYKGVPYEGRLTKLTGKANGGKVTTQHNYMDFLRNKELLSMKRK